MEYLNGYIWTLAYCKLTASAALNMNAKAALKYLTIRTTTVIPIMNGNVSNIIILHDIIC